MTCNRITTGVLLAGAVLLFTNPAAARDQIRIVGSSTVFPFATAVAEEFGRSTDFKTPIVERTGSGGGLKLFCAGVGVEHPDIANASRRIKQSEIDLCRRNGVSEISEVKVGYDGIVLANSKQAPKQRFTLQQIFLALAKEIPAPNGDWIPNPNKTWQDVEPLLPDVAIEVLGPPPTSGTRDAFNELALEGGCKTFPDVAALEKTDKARYKQVCHSIREDGAYVEAGENDNLIVQKLRANDAAFGVFGYSFLDQNGDVIQGSVIDGIAPTFDAISSGDYPVSRSLYFYVKVAHVDSIPGMKEYLVEFTSEKAYGEFGYLADKGLIPSPKVEREQFRSDAGALVILQDLPGVASK
ncbi:MAG: substrate-binding domain-containing protein [Deltaproteobacteria bacterium]|nr:substrate-binding domain-containing protein [Deltaproteobacteria bacterium]MBW2398528.1 substrate-binding domain-containing protein [Deltaproteobacteria bacterium]MBW2665215.1 substrate-binding domain-containing protein [Deltaproteobacteria bacterium]